MTDATDSPSGPPPSSKAVKLVEDGMIVHLGSNDLELFLEALAERVAAGLRITGCRPRSE